MTNNLADDPADFFGFSSHKAHHISYAEMEELQLSALQTRFAAMVKTLPPLQALSEQRGISTIDSIEQAPALSFHHSIYKSYSEEALAEHDFPALTQWLNNFTMHDLSAVMAEDFDCIDDWMEALEKQTELSPLHSSGTTGRLSFHPRGKEEREAFKKHAQMAMGELAAPVAFHPNKPDYAIVWPSYASGRAAALQAGQLFCEGFASSEEDFFPLLTMNMSADFQSFLIQAENAKVDGRFLSPTPSDYVRPMLEQSMAMQKTHHQRNEDLLDAIDGKLKGRKIFFAGGPVLLYALAKAGLERGMEDAFAPGSVVASFGGFKGLSPAGDEEAVLRRFTGVQRYWQFYGMTELSSGLYACENGRYHVPPWIIPYVLEEETGEVKPREGIQRGRAAFMDLAAQSYWGGVISADAVTMGWSNCACGRTTPHIGEDIKRIEE